MSSDAPVVLHVFTCEESIAFEYVSITASVCVSAEQSGQDAEAVGLPLGGAILGLGLAVLLCAIGCWRKTH